MESSNFNEKSLVICLGDFSSSTEKSTVVMKDLIEVSLTKDLIERKVSLKGLTSQVSLNFARSGEILSSRTILRDKTDKNQWVGYWYVQNVVVHM